MGPLLTREQVAGELGVCPTTIYRWETSKKSPVIPKRIKRTRQLRYTSEDVETLRAWMNEVEDATSEQVEDRAATPA